LLALSSLIPLSWGPVDIVNSISVAGHSTHICTAGTLESRERCKSNVGMAVIMSLAVLSMAFILFEYELPLVRLERLQGFRRKYLDSFLLPVIRALREKHGPDVRVNVMIVRRARRWPFSRVFRFVYQDGFDNPPNHRDRALRLTVDQGIAGMAYRLQLPVAKALVPGGDRRWGLSAHQADLTSHVCWILSVPMLYDSDPLGIEPMSVRGVINVDVTNPQTAVAIGTPETIQYLSERLLRVGYIASHLW
jgi:hypothetical protein